MLKKCHYCFFEKFWTLRHCMLWFHAIYECINDKPVKQEEFPSHPYIQLPATYLSTGNCTTYYEMKTSCLNFLRMCVNTTCTTVYSIKLDTSFFSNNSTNTHRRPTEHFALRFYSLHWCVVVSNTYLLSNYQSSRCLIYVKVPYAINKNHWMEFNSLSNEGMFWFFLSAFEFYLPVTIVIIPDVLVTNLITKL